MTDRDRVEELIDRAAREHWPFWKLVDEFDTLPEPERGRALASSIGAIAAELDRRRPLWRERAPVRR